MTRALIHGSAAAAPRARWRLRDALLFAAALLTGALSRLRVRARGDEGRRPLPGDEIVPDAKDQWTNAVTIRGQPADIWPWILQMGCTRAGWYSDDGLDNGGQPSAERIVPELQDIELGGVLPWTPTDREGVIPALAPANGPSPRSERSEHGRENTVLGPRPAARVRRPGGGEGGAPAS